MKNKKSSNKKNKKKKKKDRLSKLKNNANEYLPLVVIWLLRILLTFQTYLYHNSLSMLHLSWVLLSFLISFELNLFLSCIVMIPIYSWEFIMIYGLRIPLIKDYDFFAKYGDYFNWDLKWPISEQVLYFCILNLFFMTISCLKLTFESDQDYKIIDLFRSKILKNPKSSIMWRIGLFLLKHIQTVFLLILFINGINNMNCLMNIGIMIFFVLYTGYVDAYRKTSKLLTFFIAMFIYAQYYFSLVYHKYEENPKLKWYNLYDTYPTWKTDDSIYFRYKP